MFGWSIDGCGLFIYYIYIYIYIYIYCTSIYIFICTATKNICSKTSICPSKSNHARHTGDLPVVLCDVVTGTRSHQQSPHQQHHIDTPPTHATNTFSREREMKPIPHTYRYIFYVLYGLISRNNFCFCCYYRLFRWNESYHYRTTFGIQGWLWFRLHHVVVCVWYRQWWWWWWSSIILKRIILFPLSDGIHRHYNINVIHLLYPVIYNEATETDNDRFILLDILQYITHGRRHYHYFLQQQQRHHHRHRYYMSLIRKQLRKRRPKTPLIIISPAVISILKVVLILLVVIYRRYGMNYWIYYHPCGVKNMRCDDWKIVSIHWKVPIHRVKRYPFWIFSWTARGNFYSAVTGSIVLLSWNHSDYEKWNNTYKPPMRRSGHSHHLR